VPFSTRTTSEGAVRVSMQRPKRWIIVLFKIGKQECALLANIFRATRELLKAEEDVRSLLGERVEEGQASISETEARANGLIARRITV
jgi:hypothetical protein